MKDAYTLSPGSHHQTIEEIQACEFEKAKITFENYKRMFVEILGKRMLEENIFD
jgi:competence transcription factor ComK